MRFIYITASALLLTSCSMLNFTKYDSNEYNATVKIVYHASVLNCKDIKTFQELHGSVHYYVLYTEGRKANARMNENAKGMLTVITETVNRGSNMSPFFCETRKVNLITAAKLLRTGAGEKLE